MRTSDVFAWDDVELDLDRRELRRSGREQRLEPRAFDVLAHLVRHRDRVVSRDELLDAVWGDRFVSESALTTRIKEIRRACGDDGRRQAVVRNHRGRGYRFVADVEEPVRAGRSTATADTPRAGLPELIGRHEDVAEVIRRTAGGRCVTIVGPGGVGKTALALAVAAGTADRFRDGVIMADLAPLETDEVDAAIARAAGLDVDDDLPDALARLEALVVLDNCDHLVDRVGPLVERTIELPGRGPGAGPGPALLATSRERLRIRQEFVWPLLPLAPDAAAELFRRRVAAVAPRLAADELDPERLAQLLADLDHLPLAIEMAAARVGTVGLEGLLSAIDGPTDLLRAPTRTAADRHRTISALVNWSTSLLPDSLRAALVDLAVFAGPFDARAAAAVAGSTTADDATAGNWDGDARTNGDESVVVVLAELTDRSLLGTERTDGRVRYRMLSTVRSSVSPRGVHPRAAGHARWCLESTREADRLLRGPDEEHGVEIVRGLVDELRQAHRWAREHEPSVAAELTAAVQLHSHSALWFEPVEWARALLAGTGADLPGRASVLAAAAAGAATRGHLDEAVALANDAIGLAPDDTRVLIVAMDTLSDASLFLGRLTETVEHADRLVELGKDLGDPHAITIGRVNGVLARVYGGDRDGLRGALDRLDDPTEVPPSHRAPSDRAWRAYALGEALGDPAVGDDPDGAVVNLDRAIHLADRVGNRYIGTVARTSLVALRARHGDGRDALADVAPVLEDCRRHGNSVHAVTVLRNLVELLHRLGDHHHAVVLLGALSGPDVRTSFGEEARRLESSTAELRAGAGAATFERWWSEAAHVGVDGALGIAAEVVAGHLDRA
ncbi:MAG: ATP-binding protein [Microthrixaceae bacterium]